MNRREKARLIDTLLIHRYRYYVMSEPLISDAEYDALERQLSPADREDLGVGSSLAASYPEYIRRAAERAKEFSIGGLAL